MKKEKKKNRWLLFLKGIAMGFFGSIVQVLVLIMALLGTCWTIWACRLSKKLGGDDALAEALFEFENNIMNK